MEERQRKTKSLINHFANCYYKTLKMPIIHQNYKFRQIVDSLKNVNMRKQQKLKNLSQGLTTQHDNVSKQKVRFRSFSLNLSGKKQQKASNAQKISERLPTLKENKINYGLGLELQRCFKQLEILKKKISITEAKLIRSYQGRDLVNQIEKENTEFIEKCQFQRKTIEQENDKGRKAVTDLYLEKNALKEQIYETSAEIIDHQERLEECSKILKQQDLQKTNQNQKSKDLDWKIHRQYEEIGSYLILSSEILSKMTFLQKRNSISYYKNLEVSALEKQIKSTIGNRSLQQLLINQFNSISSNISSLQKNYLYFTDLKANLKKQLKELNNSKVNSQQLIDDQDENSLGKDNLSKLFCLKFYETVYTLLTQFKEDVRIPENKKFSVIHDLKCLKNLQSQCTKQRFSKIIDTLKSCLLRLFQKCKKKSVCFPVIEKKRLVRVRGSSHFHSTQFILLEELNEVQPLIKQSNRFPKANLRTILLKMRKDRGKKLTIY